MIELPLKNLALGLAFFSIVNVANVHSAAAKVSDNAKKDTLKQSYLLSLKDIANSPSGYMHANTGAYVGRKQLLIDKVIKSLIKDELQGDSEIRESLERIKDKHPLSLARQAAAFALSDASSDSLPPLFFGGLKVNETRQYCDGKSVDAVPLAALEQNLIDELTPAQQKINITDRGEVITRGANIDDVHISAHAVSGGWLTGYGVTVTDGMLTLSNSGLGLHYVPEDTSLPTEYLLDGTINAILPKANEPGTFFVLVISGHNFYGMQSPGVLDIFLVKETMPAKFEIREYRTLPSGLRQIAKMENGDLFLSFGGAEKSYERSNGMPIGRPAYSNDPAIGLTPTGHIYAICEDDAIKF